MVEISDEAIRRIRQSMRYRPPGNDVRVYKMRVDGQDHFLVADHGMWLPGGYDSAETAIYAATLGDALLQRVNDAIHAITGENRAITRADLDG